MKKILLPLLIFCQSIFAVSFDTELIVNGGAETGDTTGWDASGIEVVTPDQWASGHGSFVFTGGSGDAAGQYLSQRIDVTSAAVDIDSQQVLSDFSIYLQSRSDPGASDYAYADLIFLDEYQAIIATYSALQDFRGLSIFLKNSRLQLFLAHTAV